MQIHSLKFFTYDQNNSGGTFDFDDKAGISTKVIVQARDAEEANYRAKRIGLYFDCVGDCSCCGDRWYEQYADTDGFDMPMIYQGLDVMTWFGSQYFMKWMGPDKPELYIHLYDGQFMGFVYGDKGTGYRLFESTDAPKPVGFFKEIES